MSTDHHEHKHPHDHEATTVQAPPPEADTNEVFRVTGMDCSEEVVAIEHALKPLEGVLGVRAEIVSSKVTVYHDGTLPRDRIAEAINRSGVTVSEDGNEARRPVLPAILVGISGFATGMGLVLQWFSMQPTWLPDVAFFTAIVAGGWLVLPKAFRSLRTLTLDMKLSLPEMSRISMGGKGVRWEHVAP